MGPGSNGNGIVIRRHDLTKFRQAIQPVNQQGQQPAANVPVINP
jgi:hypothetical protein